MGDDIATAAAGASVIMATCADERHPPENVLDPTDGSFWVTTGLYPHEFIVKLGSTSQVNKVRTLTSNGTYDVRGGGEARVTFSFRTRRRCFRVASMRALSQIPHVATHPERHLERSKPHAVGFLFLRPSDRRCHRPRHRRRCLGMARVRCDPRVRSRRLRKTESASSSSSSSSSPLTPRPSDALRAHLMPSLPSLSFAPLASSEALRAGVLRR